MITNHYTPQASAAVNAELGAAILARINEEVRRQAAALKSDCMEKPRAA